MNRIADFVVERAAAAWLLAVFLAVGAGLLAGVTARDLRETERLDHLETDAERRSVELMSQTLNGNLMGSVAMLGLIDQSIKREALGNRSANTPEVTAVLESVGRSYDVEGVFIVAENGIITSSWDNAGKPSTGLNVKFRPYYQMAMQGSDNVYAAVSIARGDRALYFSAPIYRETTNATEAIGAIVARTDLMRADNLLRDKTDITLLLSPQGVVFASSRPDWIGHLAGKGTPERLRAIRELKQFGNMFENTAPPALPFEVAAGLTVFEQRRYATAVAPVKWNDPFGDWKLVMMEDMGRTVSLATQVAIGLAVVCTVLLFSILVIKMLQSHAQQLRVSRQLEFNARQLQLGAELKSGMAAAALVLQRAPDMKTLVERFLAESHRLLAVMQGVVYLSHDESGAAGRLHLAGTYACADQPPARLALGEGLLGQCAVERKGLLITTAADGFATIRSGLGETRPAAVLLVPVLLNESLLGVVEVAFLSVPDDDTRSRFDELIGFLAMNIEITSRSANTEAALSAISAIEDATAEQLVFQQSLIDTIPYPVFYKGPDSRFLGVNRAYEETFAVQREQLLGRRVLDLDYLPESDRLAYQAEDEATIANTGRVDREMTIPFADGRLHRTRYFVSGFRCSDGTPGGLVGTFMDLGVAGQEAPQ